MISIKNSLSALERAHALLENLAQSHRATVTDLAMGVTALDVESAAPFTEEIVTAAARMNGTVSESLAGNSAALHTALPAWFEKVREYIGEQRLERAATERALREVVASLSQADADHDGKIRLTVDHLRALTRSPEGKGLRDALRAAADAIEESMEQIRRQHQIAIAQFHNEIRALQMRIDPAEAESQSDSLLRIYCREEMCKRITDMVPGPLWMVLLHVRGIRHAEVQFGAGVAAELSSAFAVRFRNTLATGAAIGLWAEEKLLALIPADSSRSTASVCKVITEHLPGPYACFHDGKTVRPTIDVSVCIVESTAKDTAEQVLERIEMSFARI